MIPSADTLHRADRWLIETTCKSSVLHIAPVDTTDALCGTTPSAGCAWRTPPKMLRGTRVCANCERKCGA